MSNHSRMQNVPSSRDPKKPPLSVIHPFPFLKAISHQRIIIPMSIRRIDHSTRLIVVA